jgi:hypothetical protein
LTRPAGCRMVRGCLHNPASIGMLDGVLRQSNGVSQATADDTAGTVTARRRFTE